MAVAIGAAFPAPIVIGPGVTAIFVHVGCILVMVMIGMAMRLMPPRFAAMLACIGVGSRHSWRPRVDPGVSAICTRRVRKSRVSGAPDIAMCMPATAARPGGCMCRDIMAVIVPAVAVAKGLRGGGSGKPEQRA